MFLVAPSDHTIVRYWVARRPPFNAIPPGAEVFHGFQTAFIDQTLAGRNRKLEPDIFDNLADFDAGPRGAPEAGGGVA